MPGTVIESNAPLPRRIFLLPTLMPAKQQVSVGPHLMITSPGFTSTKKSCSMHRLLPAITGGKSRKKKHPVLLCGLPSSWTRHLVLLQLWDCHQATLCLGFLIWKGKRLTAVTFQRHYEDEMCPSAVSEHINSQWASSPCNVRRHLDQHIRAC